MLIENHTERVTKIPIMVTHEKTGHVAEADAIVLMPGVNEVDPSKWDKVKDFEMVKILIGLGRRKGGLVAGDPKKSIKTLEGMSEKDAIDLVEECVEATLLAAWKASEKREKVLAAVQAQIDKIDPKKAKTKPVE